MKTWTFAIRGDVPKSVPACSATATADGWLVNTTLRNNSPLSAYLTQLSEEGLAQPIENGLLIRWGTVYRLIADPDHAASVPLLSLPPLADDRPCLIAIGTPSDQGFTIRIKQWSSISTDERHSQLERCGAVLDPRTRPRLIAQPAFALLGHLEELATNGATLTGQERLQLMGRVQKIASEISCPLDAYLSSTRVVVSDHMTLELVRGEALDTPVVEVVPHPEGAPDAWLSQFDRYNSVQSRYDTPTPDGGITHVVLSDDVQKVAAQIKAMPARRLGGEQADSFLSNPYPFLGDGAESVVSKESFERARQGAGWITWELDLDRDGDGWGVLLIDPNSARGSEFAGHMDIDAARALLRAAEQAHEHQLSVFRWNKHAITLAGVTLESLRSIRRASFDGACTAAALSAADLFNLQYYSDRVVGFDGHPEILVPLVAVPGQRQPWASDDQGVAIAAVNPLDGTVNIKPLSKDDIDELGRRLDAAKAHSALTVTVPGLESDIPTAEASSWIEAIKSASKPRKQDTPKEPKPADKLSLRILHNIENLDYAPTNNSPSRPNGAEHRLPAALRESVTLLPHQQDGLAWLQQRLAELPQGVRGVLLADDMGLGKTLQSLCLMAWYRQTAARPHPCLIVAPVSLLQNWQAEIVKFLDGSQGSTLSVYGPTLSLYRLSKPDVDRELRGVGLKNALRPGFAKQAAIVLTTYETLRDYQLSFAREHWGVMVCDEAQKIKTPGAMVTRAAKAMQVEFKIACTGTPVENTLGDLWCLFDYFQPGLLDSLSKFTKTFRQDIEGRTDGHASKVDILRAEIAPWVLRRMKSNVARLPPKRDIACDLAMSSLQKELYAAAIQAFRGAVDGSSEATSDSTILGLLHRLRAICANPLAEKSAQAEHLDIREHIRHSPKLAWLLETLEPIRQCGEKVIVFTEFREIQRLIQRAIASRFAFKPDIVNGSTSVVPLADASRQAIIDRYQEQPGFSVIILSTTAVGFGVNIQAANHVIHFTRPWNPAKEDQATDRAYRIGQQREVHVYCPTIVGDDFESFEQRVADRLASKRLLSRDMLAPEQSIGLEDFADLGT